MPLPSFRSSRSKVRRRRSHHALKQIATGTCAACGAVVTPHRACKSCGAYGARTVRRTGQAEVEKVLARATRAKAASAGPSAVPETPTSTKSAPRRSAAAPRTSAPRRAARGS